MDMDVLWNVRQLHFGMVHKYRLVASHKSALPSAVGTLSPASTSSGWRTWCCLPSELLSGTYLCSCSSGQTPQTVHFLGLSWNELWCWYSQFSAYSNLPVVLELSRERINVRNPGAWNMRDSQFALLWFLQPSIPSHGWWLGVLKISYSFMIGHQLSKWWPRKSASDTAVTYCSGFSPRPLLELLHNFLQVFQVLCDRPGK